MIRQANITYRIQFKDFFFKHFISNFSCITFLNSEIKTTRMHVRKIREVIQVRNKVNGLWQQTFEIKLDLPVFFVIQW